MTASGPSMTTRATARGCGATWPSAATAKRCAPTGGGCRAAATPEHALGSRILCACRRAPTAANPRRRLDRLMARFAQSRVGGLLFITVFPAIDKRLMPLTGGRLKIGMRQPVLLLRARGAKSGQPRTVPLLYTPRGEDFVLVASKAGAVKHPAWYHNLRAHPD